MVVGTSTLGDGVISITLPLLAVSSTHNPLLVSAVASVTWLPWLLIGPVAGALVDRWDRQLIIVYSSAGRSLAALALAVVTGIVGSSICLLLVVGFALGCGRVLFDSASQAIVPATVTTEPDRLHRANSRLVGTQTVNEQFVGGPVAGFMYSVAAAFPLVCDAVLYAGSALLALRLPRLKRAESTDRRTRTLRTDMAEGMRYLARNSLFRSLALTAAVVNLAFMAGDGILVLYAKDRLGLGSVGFGLLTAPIAVGGLFASGVAAGLIRRVSAGVLLTATLAVLSLAQVGLALTTTTWMAVACLGLSGAGATLFNIFTQSLRQGAVPENLLGRVIATSRLIGLGAIPVGSLLGGVIARHFGVQAPFFSAAVLLAFAMLVTVRITENRPLRNDDRPGRIPTRRTD